jgi:branched-chain amino acid transport system substrate-binding protein
MDAMDALKIAKQHINLYFKNKNFQVELEVKNSSAGKYDALTALTELNNEGVDIVIGPFKSTELDLLQDYANDKKIVLISPSSTAPSLSKDDYVIRLSPDDTHQALAITSLLKRQGKKCIIIIYEDTIYGNDLEKYIAQYFEGDNEQNNLSPGYVYSTYKFDVDDYISLDDLQSDVDDALNTYKPEEIAIVYIGFENEGVKFNELSQYSVLQNIHWYGTDSIAFKINISDNEKMRKIMQSIDFTFSVFDYNAFQMYLPQIYCMKVILNKPNTLLSYIINTYDALWLAALSKYQLAIDNNQDTDLITEVLNQAQKTYGMSTPLMLDYNGDRGTSAYGFYTPKNNEWHLKYIYTNLGFFEQGIVEQ